MTNKEQERKSSLLPMIIVILGFFMAILDQTIVNVALPKITDYYGSSVSQISWVVNAYSLAFGVFLLIAARLADQFGHKKGFIIGVLLFTVSSFLCGKASSVEMLIFFRVLQGLGAAMIIPVTAPLAVKLLPEEKTGMVGALFGGMAGLAGTAGPALGGFISDRFDWQWIFYINIPIGVLTIVLTMLLIKESRDPYATKKLDIGGMLTLSISILALLYAFMKVNDKGWTSSFILGLFAVFAVGFSLFLIIQAKSKSAMIPLSLFKNGGFTAGTIGLFLLGIGMMSSLFLLAFFLTNVIGDSQLKAGLIIMSMAIASMLVSGVAAALSDKYGTRWLGVIGLVLMGLGTYLLGDLNQEASNWAIIWRLIITGIGMGMTLAPMMGATLVRLPVDKIGIGSGIVNVARAIGSAFGVAVLVVLLNSNANAQFDTAKTEAVQMIAMSDLSQQTKDSMTTSIQKVEFKQGGNKVKSLDEVLTAVDQKEKDTISDIWPKLQAAFKNHTVNSFQYVFKWSSLALFLAAIFAYFNGVKPQTSTASTLSREVSVD